MVQGFYKNLTTRSIRQGAQLGSSFAFFNCRRDSFPLHSTTATRRYKSESCNSQDQPIRIPKMTSPQMLVNVANVPTVSTHSDLVFVRELSCKAVTGMDAWKRPQRQPVSISIWLHTDVSKAGISDHLTHSLNYDVISRNVTQMVESGTFKSLEQIASKVAEAVLADRDTNGGQWTTVHVKKPRALLRADCAEIVISRIKVDNEIQPAKGNQDVVKIHRLRLVTVIGVNTIERLHKQNVVIDLVLYKDREPTVYTRKYDFRQIVDAVTDHVEDSRYKTIEAFVTSVAQVVTSCGVDRVTVRAEKPSAITFAEAAGVEITRTREFFESELSPDASEEVEQGTKGDSNLPLFPSSGGNTNASSHIAYLAFGSNEGQCIKNIYNSAEELRKRDIKVLQTSTIHISEPMFVQDQAKFHNGVFKVETKLSPIELLDACKDIENTLKRVKIIDNGPRTIDLDILLYDDDLVMDTPRLQIPHRGMLSRSFVLGPLVELTPVTQVHPLTAETFLAHLGQIPTSSDVQSSSDTQTYVPLPHGIEGSSKRQQLTFDLVSRKCPTLVMAILNATPDSFSDGGKYMDVNALVAKACEFVKQGAHILDIGGMSTSPNSTDPGQDEELQRVIPAIEALRKCPELENIPISVDTYRATVAQRAIEAGADIINDISAGTLDPEIINVARDTRAPIILNHTRGTPQTMNSLAHYSTKDIDDAKISQYADNSDQAVVEVVARELEERLDQVMAQGVPRWQIILDPGLGFAKNKRQNIALCRNLTKLVNRPAFKGIPWLVGPSRKRFIGTVTKQEQPDQRVMGTAASVTCLIQQGADIVRVHDVKDMVDVCRMADAIYRGVE